MSYAMSWTDLFCGAGGSSTGAIQVPGVKVAMAANHWRLAVETHNTNHPTTDHDCADLSQVDPRRYPRTDGGWFSPECTNHSQAKGRKRNADATPDLFGQTLPDEAAERSRATMWDVLRFTEHHRYSVVIVENVVDAAKWVMWPAWRSGLDALGYCVHVVYLNSMHAQAGGDPAPQSRDRMYAVAHLKTTKCPDLDRWTRPRAYCPGCDQVVRAMQAWKKPGSAWGRYRAQYVWRCPNVACRNQVVEPGWLPASAAIDWSLPGERIGDRARPLAAKTLARVRAGIDKHWGPFTMEAAGNTFERRPGVRTWPVDDVLRTLHTTASKALLVPVEGRDGKTALPSSEAMRTMTTRNETGLLVPAGGTWNESATSLAEVMRTRTTTESEALVIPMRNNNTSKPAGAEPFDTFAANGNHHALLMPYYGNATTRTTDAPHGTLTTRDRYALVEPGSVDVEDCLFRMLEPHEVAAGMAFTPGYVVLGNKRERVRQLGNAVTPPAARDLIAATAACVGHELPDLDGWSDTNSLADRSAA